MKKIKLLTLLILIYFIFSLFISILFISKFILDKNSKNLDYFLNNFDLQKNIKTNILKQSDYVKKELKFFSFNSNKITFSGELSDSFLNKKIELFASTISRDLSKPNAIIYFYDNSEQLHEYIHANLENLDQYSFEEFILNKKLINNDKKKNINNSDDNNIKLSESILSKLYSQFLSKYKNVKYFFFSSPIHFKMTVMHKNILFSLSIKFNGIIWQLDNIDFIFEDLI